MAALPCHPWSKGNHVKPQRKICALCPMAFKHGGFEHKYSTLDNLIQAMKSDAQLQAEFDACVKKLIQYVNEGVVSQRIKGGKRDEIRLGMEEERNKVVSVIASESASIKTKMRAIKLEKYLEENPHVDVQNLPKGVIRKQLKCDGVLTLVSPSADDLKR